MNTAPIQEFIDKIQWTHEVEIGDFRRKLGLYLNRLEQQVPKEQQSKDFKRAISKIRQEYIFCAKADLETTREEVVASLRPFL